MFFADFNIILQYILRSRDNISNSTFIRNSTMDIISLLLSSSVAPQSPYFVSITSFIVVAFDKVSLNNSAEFNRCEQIAQQDELPSTAKHTSA